MPKIAPVHFRLLVRVFEKEHFIYSHTKGDHLFYIKPGIKRPLVIPRYRQIPIFIIQNLLQTAGISRERYFELLKS